jgi:hypothetical protein
MKGCIYHNWDMYLVFDPTVSPHYEVVLDGVPSIRIVFIFRL